MLLVASLVCVCTRESVCVCVCVRERVCVREIVWLVSEVPLHAPGSQPAHPSSSSRWLRCVTPQISLSTPPERELFLDNLLVRIHSILELISVDRPCAMGVRIPFSR